MRDHLDDEELTDPEDTGIHRFDARAGIPPRPAPAERDVLEVRHPCPACSRLLPAGLASCPVCLSPLDGSAPAASSPATAVRLVFRGAGGHLEVLPGTEMRLGTDDAWSPGAAALLAGETTVSRMHASVACSGDGRLTVTEVSRGSRNGVRVNDRVLTPGTPEPLRGGDVVSLGPEVTFTVQEPGGPP
ncbi:FHA domain-containing protein [Streptomyces sp. NPDC005794]|uniref:FHA domain-containing protein n=1 Tax=Streptomyces sp. NPDC005794 TaxID=3364733 RepID=UPI0036A7D7B3